ncbi:hypothetical protein TMEN_384 [Trichophyton mentagrophytes]|uniref:Transmembrane protein 135 N-terminal domain-containing protein n=1 Tax=Trichophyton interdigitale (strain MR816) TaxID=1215338 RepID=A0A059J3V0_TRIIM|nr:hypothetical protein H101_03194 [Trichophyton interdigitale H6]KDB22343.1 hypothetical protein H109_05701 [Trichophyton interdigitale MR816]GBF59534.1 hypothetical protein TMEN_384 [Trichophyton mentagrophytes]
MASNPDPDAQRNPPSLGFKAQKTVLRLLCSGEEYRKLHESVIQNLPQSIQDRAYSPATFNNIIKSRDKYTTAALRSSIRLFWITRLGMKLLDFIKSRIIARAGTSDVSSNAPFRDSPAFRLPLSLSLMLLFHRLLHRFFSRLRANLRTDNAQPFRERNPRISKALTSKYAPAIGASLAGFFLGLYPQAQLRLTVAIYASTRSLEVLYNALLENGWLSFRPWWFGSWLLMPLSMAQLFHAFVFDREATPSWFGNVILKFTPGYIKRRPSGLPGMVAWPEPFETVDALAKVAELKWPPFTSPILHPSVTDTLPAAVQTISPITSPSHPAIASLSCALLHPKSPSCLTAFIHQVLLSVPPLVRSVAKVYLALSVLKFKSFVTSPVTSINEVSKKILSATALISSSIGAAWGSICLFNAVLPRKLLPTQRFYLSGAISGLPFAVLCGSGYRAHFLYLFRQAVESAWKTGVKRGLWRGYKGGDLWVLVASWALLGVLLERNPANITDQGFRKALTWMRGDGYNDLAERRAKKSKRDSAEQARSS